jgi:hypothetical protein
VNGTTDFVNACGSKEVDGSGRLGWLQSLINEARRHGDAISDGDLNGLEMCLSEVQALHDDLQAALDASGRAA